MRFAARCGGEDGQHYYWALNAQLYWCRRQIPLDINAVRAPFDMIPTPADRFPAWMCTPIQRPELNARTIMSDPAALRGRQTLCADSGSGWSSWPNPNVWNEGSRSEKRGPESGARCLRTNVLVCDRSHVAASRVRPWHRTAVLARPKCYLMHDENSRGREQCIDGG